MSNAQSPSSFLAGGGQLGNLIRAKDWATTPLGPVETWPESLRTSVSICLNCSFPILIWWGPELVKIYNDAYAEIIAAKHPHALGNPGRAVWPEIWDIIGPMLGRVLDAGEAFPANDLRLDLHRKGYSEECYFSFSYSPIRDETGRVAGVFCPVIETTARVFAERRAALLLDLEDQLHEAANPILVKRIISAQIGAHLGVAQAGYAEVRADDEFVQVEGAWNNGNTPSLDGVHRLEDFGASLIADLRRDRVVSVNDVRSDPRTCSSEALQSFAKIQMRSFLDVPLFKGGRLLAYLFVSDSKPRLWSSYDVDLLRELAERLWSAVERTRAQTEAECERKRSEDALRNWNAQLETRVAEEVAAREAAQHVLAHAQRMEGLGQLAGGIAHDFNNVLQTVVGGLELIRKRADNPEVVRQIVRMATEATERGVSVTSRLLAFSRKSELTASPVRTLELLENLREILESTLATGVTIRIEATSDTPPLMADKAQLETVLINLAVNARDAMPKGGSLVIAAYPESVEPGTAHQAGLRPGRYVRLEVIDTGIGMDSATLARASEPFFSTKGPGQGTGLGLAMARGFAEQSAGGFAIQSTLGKGTTVTLWFPDAIGAADAGDNRVETVDSSIVDRLCALVVDDDRMVREMLAAQLKELGFEILEASDGLAALARLDSEEKVDLLVTDYAMPGMNGLVLSLEARRRRTQLPVMLLTGYVEAHMQSDFNDIKASGIVVLRKPVLPGYLGKVAVELVANGRSKSQATSIGARPLSDPPRF
jgi:signal transduction histidine kinase/ActR/RegA family two-component response regulator